VYTAKLHNLNLFAYMKDVIERIGGMQESQLEQFLPDVWKKAHACEAPQAQTSPDITP